MTFHLNFMCLHIANELETFVNVKFKVGFLKMNELSRPKFVESLV